MIKYYHIIVEGPDGRREEITHKNQHPRMPQGYKMIGVCGYYEVPSTRSNQYICPQCGYGF